MSTDSNYETIREIDRELDEKRKQMEFHRTNLENFKKDPDMIDAATRENGRINMLAEAIAKLEEEKRALQNK
jgi:hypothetical protein